MFSLKLPSFTWVEALVPAEELKDIVIYVSSKGQGPYPHTIVFVGFLVLSCHGHVGS